MKTPPGVEDLEVWVESRSGGFHRDPFIVTPLGFLAFHAENPPIDDGIVAELVLFERNGVSAFPAIALQEMVGPEGYDQGRLTVGPRGERAVPGAGGAATMTVSFGVMLTRRIPEPSHSTGSERRKSRLLGRVVFSAPEHPEDLEETAGPTLSG